MPVIGRLDRQVEDVLIRPVAGRGREEAAPEREEAAPERAEAATKREETRPALAADDAPPSAVGRPENPEDGGGRPGALEHEGHHEPPGEAAGRARLRDLPVWML